jgi:hypothetical protein
MKNKKWNIINDPRLENYLIKFNAYSLDYELWEYNDYRIMNLKLKHERLNELQFLFINQVLGYKLNNDYDEFSISLNSLGFITRLELCK